ncbi:glycosyltransferase [Aliarcobacter cryaerophilus]|uniref:glycosyltransferase n=1 Tax=Aliarcobacter cryaerophilus TaxID=28198 RepID=UPI003DA48241
MKIVYISNSIIPSRNANSVHVMNMCQAFAKNGHSVVLLAPNHKFLDKTVNIYDYYGVEKIFEIKYIDYKNIPKIWTFAYSLSVYSFLKKLEVDIIFGRDLRSCFLSSKLNKKINIYYESHKPYNKYNFIDKILMKIMINSKNFKNLIVISNALKQIYIKDGFNQNILKIAHDGANLPKDDMKIRSITRQSNRLKVGYTGHLYAGRGIDIIIELANRLKNFEFHIVGGNEEDINYWKSQLESNNLIFHGFVEPSEVYKYVNSFDILLAPYQNKVSIAGKDDSSQYMSPLKLFEYMAAKKVIIVSDLEVIHEVLNETNSKLVKYDDIDAWEKAVLELSDMELRNKLSQNAYDEFLKYFSWEERAKNVI